MRPLLPPAGFVLAFSLLLLGCWESGSGGDFRTPEPPTPEVDASMLCTQEGATRCDDNRFQTCLDGAWSAGISCETPTPLCHDQDGCTACPAGTTYCLGRSVYECSDDGTVANLVSECADTEACLAGSCFDACSAAESQLSYLGCSFVAVPTANLLDGGFAFDFAVVIGNPNDVPAEVTIRHQGSAWETVDVPAEDSLAVTLPYLEALQDTTTNTIAEDGAFELRSSVPVAAYQYSPLHFRAPGNPNAYSYTNDASLLIPEHALTGNYIVSAWPSLGFGDAPATVYDWIPGYVAIAATRNTTVVTITAGAETVGGAVGPMAIDDEQSVTLDRGDVLQVFSHQPTQDMANPCNALGGDRTQVGDTDLCLSVSAGDLTGTRISANEPIAVFAGHVCTFVPYNEWACDHLEEAMLPVETWGSTVPVSAPTFPGASNRAPTWVRIISVTDGNLLRFDPPIQPDQFLDSGAILEFEADQHFVVDANSPVLVTQFMLGQEALDAQEGDPSMGTAAPTSQFRPEYDFLVPDTYIWNHVNVVAEAGAQVYLDSQLLMEWEPIGDSGLSVARLSVEPGAHRIVSVDEVPFGITSYGYAPFTSYLHPGGLNLLR